MSVINYNSIEGTDGQLTVTLVAGIETDDITWFNELEETTGDSISVNQSGLYTVLVNTDSCSGEVSGILVEDEGLDCNLAASVDVVPPRRHGRWSSHSVHYRSIWRGPGELVR